MKTVLFSAIAFIAGALIAHKFQPDWWLPRPANLKSVAPGCTLLAPTRLASGEGKQAHESVFLVNNRGNIVHSWKSHLSIDAALLDGESNLWISSVDPDNLKGEPSRVQRLSWKGELLKEYIIPGMTHDFALKSDGSAFLTETETELLPPRLPSAFREARIVAATRPWQTQSLVEVEVSSGKVRKTWDLLTIFPQTKPNALQLETRELFHVNSVRFLETNPINGRPAILLSVRNLLLVALLDYETGQIIWAYQPNPGRIMHDARLLPNGDLLVFNNNNNFASGEYSSIDQINLETKKAVWTFRSGRRKNFNNSSQGAAQRLENGNTLITNSYSGHIFEVTPEGEVVLEFLNTRVLNPANQAWPFASIFRAIKYNEREIHWKKLGVDCS